MKILFTGGGSGGHFYPIIAVSEAIHDIVREERLLEPLLYYAAPTPYDQELLFGQNITFVKISAGKIRRYFSIFNITDIIKTAWGVTGSIIRMFFVYPDVVFGKGGYASFPALLAARLFRIPVVIHESDAVPGRVNKWAGRFAQKIAVSYPETAEFFPADKVALTGNPVRKAAVYPAKEGSHEFFGLEKGIPVLLIVGGSQGSQTLNDAIIQGLPDLLEHYQIIHQTGAGNLEEVQRLAALVLDNSAHKDRYKPYAYLSDLQTRMAAGAASLVISRAGSTIFEIALWGLPSIIVPIPEAISHDQTKNAFSYARSGGCTVIEQHNLTPHLLASEIHRIVDTPAIAERMAGAARAFARTDAAKLIAHALIDIGISHELE